MSVIRPPVIRSALGVLDRSLFSKLINLSAAAIADKKNISVWKQKLQKDCTLLVQDRIPGVVPHPDEDLAAKGTKCLLLDPKIKAGGNADADAERDTPVVVLNLFKQNNKCINTIRSARNMDSDYQRGRS